MAQTDGPVAILGIGAMVSDLSAAPVKSMLERVGVADAIAWCREKLGVSVQSKRGQAYAIARRAKKPA